MTMNALGGQSMMRMTTTTMIDVTKTKEVHCSVVAVVAVVVATSCCCCCCCYWLATPQMAVHWLTVRNTHRSIEQR